MNWHEHVKAYEAVIFGERLEGKLSTNEGAY